MNVICEDEPTTRIDYKVQGTWDSDQEQLESEDDQGSFEHIRLILPMDPHIHDIEPKSIQGYKDEDFIPREAEGVTLLYVITLLMNLPEGNNLLWALFYDMDGEENLDIYRLVSMSEGEIKGLEYTPDGVCANVKLTELISGLRAQVHTFVSLIWA